MTTRIEVTYFANLTWEPEYEGEVFDAADLLAEAADKVMERLLDTPGIEDPSVSATLSTGDVEVYVIASGDTAAAASDYGQRAIHEALVGAGIRMDDHLHWQSTTLTPA